MNLSPRWVDYLAQRQIVATHWATLGAPDATDAEITAHAADIGAIVMTSDMDFGAILAATAAAGPSVVLVRAENLSPEAIEPRIPAALATAGDTMRAGAFLTADGRRARLRPLPFWRSPPFPPLAET